jgi:hypothetical protein
MSSVRQQADGDGLRFADGARQGAKSAGGWVTSWKEPTGVPTSPLPAWHPGSADRLPGFLAKLGKALQGGSQGFESRGVVRGAGDGMDDFIRGTREVLAILDRQTLRSDAVNKDAILSAVEWVRERRSSVHFRSMEPKTQG